VQDNALWAFLGGENKHHILYMQFIAGSIGNTMLHENAIAIMRLLHEQFCLEEGANTAGGCRIERCGRC